MEIRVHDVRGPQIAALLRTHLDDMARHSPPASLHAFDLAALRVPGVTMWSAWDGSDLAGCGALRALRAGRVWRAARFGFVPCGPFGDHTLDPFIVFMTRRLPGPGESRPGPGPRR